jgi:hypothetical protein
MKLYKMPGTGHSGRFKGSISNRASKGAFQVLAPWNSNQNGKAGEIAVAVGDSSLKFSKLEAKQMSNYDAATNTFYFNCDISSNNGGGADLLWLSGGPNSIYYDAGNPTLARVGIGTQNPQTMLEVTGVLTVGNGIIDMSGTNTAMGTATNTMSTWNVAIGYNALANNVTTGNVAIGATALTSSTIGAGNTATGYAALKSNMTGTGNVALGRSALADNSGGNYNVAVGYWAGRYQPVDISNTISIGYDTSCNVANTAVIGNSSITDVYLGSTSGEAKLTCNGLDSSGAVQFKTQIISSSLNPGTIGQVLVSKGPTAPWEWAVSASSLWTNGSGGTINYDVSGADSKVGIGTTTPATTLEVAGVLTVGDGIIDMSGANVAIGTEALLHNISGIKNVANGDYTLHLNSGGNNNVATGYSALGSNTDGSGNVATGMLALQHNTTGYDNTATGFKAIYTNVTGVGNVATGYQTLRDNSGNNNTAIGYKAGMSQVEMNNTINIGYNSYCNDSNTAVIGNASITDVYLGSIDGLAKLDCSGIMSSGDVQFNKDIKDAVGSSGTVGQVLVSKGSGAGWEWGLPTFVYDISGATPIPIYNMADYNAVLTFTIPSTGTYWLSAWTETYVASNYVTPTSSICVYRTNGGAWIQIPGQNIHQHNIQSSHALAAGDVFQIGCASNIVVALALSSHGSMQRIA